MSAVALHLVFHQTSPDVWRTLGGWLVLVGLLDARVLQDLRLLISARLLDFGAKLLGLELKALGHLLGHLLGLPLLSGARSLGFGAVLMGFGVRAQVPGLASLLPLAGGRLLGLGWELEVLGCLLAGVVIFHLRGQKSSILGMSPQTLNIQGPEVLSPPPPVFCRTGPDPAWLRTVRGRQCTPPPA